MPRVQAQWPDDIEALKSLLAEQQARNEQLIHENLQIKAQVLSLQEQLNLALVNVRQLFEGAAAISDHGQ